MHSYPPYPHPLSLFHLPDTFAPTDDAFPGSLRLFQRLNLLVSRTNKAYPGSLLSFSGILLFIRLLLSGVISFRLLLFIASHLFKELLSSKYKSIRTFVQCSIAFNLFINQLRSKRPQFSTFFTNHVAGVMHRYWSDLYPEDFSSPLIRGSFYQDIIFRALDLVDNQLHYLLNSYSLPQMNLLIISSMGQASVDWPAYETDYRVKDFIKFFSCLGLDPDDYIVHDSMYPDLIIDSNSLSAKNSLICSLEQLVDSNDVPLIIRRYPNSTLTSNFSYNSSSTTNLKHSVFYKSSCLLPSQLCLEFFNRETGTGYHIPQGILLAYGTDIERTVDQTPNDHLNIIDIQSLILKYYNKYVPS